MTGTLIQLIKLKNNHNIEFIIPLNGIITMNLIWHSLRANSCHAEIFAYILVHAGTRTGITSNFFP
jgi:hypothetical protein